MKLEEWKNIENYPNYQVSNLGNVKSKERYTKAKDNMIIHRKEKILKQLIDSKGYCYVRLYNANKFKNIKVHRLVASAFIPNINNEPTIDHIDRNKKNNNINNLRWASNIIQANNKDKTNIIEHMRKLGKSKKALLKRWHPQQFSQMAYKIGD